MTSPLEVHNVFGVVPGQAVYSNTHTVVRKRGAHRETHANPPTNRKMPCTQRWHCWGELVPRPPPPPLRFRSIPEEFVCLHVRSTTHPIPHRVGRDALPLVSLEVIRRDDKTAIVDPPPSLCSGGWGGRGGGNDARTPIPPEGRRDPDLGHVFLGIFASFFFLFVSRARVESLPLRLPSLQSERRAQALTFHIHAHQ